MHQGEDVGEELGVEVGPVRPGEEYLKYLAPGSQQYLAMSTISLMSLFLMKAGAVAWC